MSTHYTIPSYLPKSLRAHVDTQFQYDKARNVIYPLERLVAYQSMREVWDKLATFCPEKIIEGNKELDTQPLIDFLAFVNGHSSLSGEYDDYITVPSDNLQREAFRLIQKSFDSIITELQSLCATGSLEEGWNVLKQAVNRSSKLELESKVLKTPKNLAQLQFDLNRINDALSIQEILETITFAAMAASHAKDSHLPKRRDTKRAKVNRFILDLSNYFSRHFNQPLDKLVTITTNVAFDFTNDEITQDFVYKLRNQPKRQGQ